MALFLSNEDQEQAITVKEAIEALEEGLAQMAHGDAIRRPRIDSIIPTQRPEEFFSFSSAEGGVRRPGYFALRIKPDIVSWPVVNGMRRRVTYCSEPGLYGGLVLLFNVDNAELLSIMNDGFVQHLRVGATAAIGVKYLAKVEAPVLGVIGSGSMARSLAEAFSLVRDIRSIKVFSPTREHAEAYSGEISQQLGCDVVAVDAPKDAVEGADIVATCTNSYTPVIRGEWLEPGMHIANVMSSELGSDVCERIEIAGLVVRRRPPSAAGFMDDDFGIYENVMAYAGGQPEERAKIPTSSWDWQRIKSRERYPNARYVDCVDWKTGTPYRRAKDTEITTLATQSFGVLEGDIGPSAGIQGLQFATIGGQIYENARKKGLGRELPREMFLQDLPS